MEATWVPNVVGMDHSEEVRMVVAKEEPSVGTSLHVPETNQTSEDLENEGNQILPDQNQET